MNRRTLSFVALLVSLLAHPAPAAVPHRHAPGRPVLRAGALGSRQTTKLSKAARPVGKAQGAAVAPPPKNGSTLPPMRPTVLKAAQSTGPLPAVSASAVPGSATAPNAPAAPLTAAQIRAQQAPPDAAPLRPPPAAVTGTPTPTATPLPPTARVPAKTAAKVDPPRAPAMTLPSPRPPASAQSTTALPLAPQAAVAPVPAPTPPASPKAATLPPGPLTRSPLGISASPNEVRISGLGSSSAPWSIVLLLTFLTLIPSILICVTPFARLLVVFHFLRQALGLQTTPSNQTLIGLTLILTFFIMEPVGKQIYEQSFIPLQGGTITPFEALARGKEPMREFMVHFVREKDASLFLEIAKEPRPRDIHDLSMRVLVPAYIVSELKSGFQIGAVLFLPFLVVDIVVASITTSVGMMQLPPVVISTPLKLLLFLMVDGWHLLIGALVRSFA